MAGYKRALAEAKYFAKADYVTLKIGNHGYVQGQKTGRYAPEYEPGSGTILREMDAYDRYTVQNLATNLELRNVREYELAEALATLEVYNEGWIWYRNDDTDMEKYRNFCMAIRANDAFERIEVMPQLKVEV